MGDGNDPDKDNAETSKSREGSVLDFGYDLFTFWRSHLTQYLWRPNEKSQLFTQLLKAKSYEEWHDVALRLDHIQGNDVWRSDPASPYYDYKLISSLVFKLEQLQKQKRLEELAEVVRSGLIRNMGSIVASELYTRAYAGTKSLIESYVTTVSDSLLYLNWYSNVMIQQKDSSIEGPEIRSKLRTYFRNSRQSYGRTALILQGGSLFGLCHLGIIKSLLDQQLLPSVICGAAVGSIVAAYICSISFSKIEGAIADVPQLIAAQYDKCQIKKESKSPEWQYSLFTQEILMFLSVVMDKLGDMTFEEAYIKSGRILNILVHSTTSSSGTFYNYLTTPKVVVRSAILASIGTNVLPDGNPFDLLVKDHEGKIQLHPDSPQEFWPANQKTYVPPRDSPYTRLAELFNVNNYIVSISRPYFAPLLLTEFKYRGQPRMWQKLVSLVRLSAQYRVGQLADWGLISPKLKSVFIDEIIPGGSQVTVVPEFDAFIHDLVLVFHSKDFASKVSHWIELGERSVWPQISIIWARTKIEYVLEEILEEYE